MAYVHRKPAEFEGRASFVELGVLEVRKIRGYHDEPITKPACKAALDSAQPCLARHEEEPRQAAIASMNKRM